MVIANRQPHEHPQMYKVLDYLIEHAHQEFEHYDKRLQEAFPNVKPKSLGWYLWMLERNGYIEKRRQGRRVYFGYDLPPVPKAVPPIVENGGETADKFTFTVLLERDEDGFVVASCPVLPGCHTQGKSREEAIANIREAIKGYIASMRRHGEAIPQEDVARVEVEVAA